MIQIFDTQERNQEFLSYIHRGVERVSDGLSGYRSVEEDVERSINFLGKILAVTPVVEERFSSASAASNRLRFLQSPDSALILRPRPTRIKFPRAFWRRAKKKCLLAYALSQCPESLRAELLHMGDAAYKLSNIAQYASDLQFMRIMPETVDSLNHLIESKRYTTSSTSMTIARHVIEGHGIAARFDYYRVNREYKVREGIRNYEQIVSPSYGISNGLVLPNGTNREIHRAKYASRDGNAYEILVEFQQTKQFGPHANVISALKDSILSWIVALIEAGHDFKTEREWFTHATKDPYSDFAAWGKNRWCYRSVYPSQDSTLQRLPYIATACSLPPVLEAQGKRKIA